MPRPFSFIAPGARVVDTLKLKTSLKNSKALENHDIQLIRHALDGVAHLRYIQYEREVPMSKTTTVRARLEPSLKETAEEILNRLGLSTTQAITLFFRQIEMNEGLPFDVRIPSSLTKKTMDKTDSRKELVLCEDADDMFEQLGV